MTTEATLTNLRVLASNTKGQMQLTILRAVSCIEGLEYELATIRPVTAAQKIALNTYLSDWPEKVSYKRVLSDIANSNGTKPHAVYDLMDGEELVEEIEELAKQIENAIREAKL